MKRPNGHGKMVIKRVGKKVTFRGLNITVLINQYTCKVCGIEAGTVKQAANIQKRISEVYHRAKKKKNITRIAMKFPEERMVYDAAHKEKIWKKQPNGAIIPYTDSAELTGL